MCLGSGKPPVQFTRKWADRERYVVETCCSVCGTRRAVRADGGVRIHRAPEGVPLPRPSAVRPPRVVTQK